MLFRTFICTFIVTFCQGNMNTVREMSGKCQGILMTPVAMNPDLSVTPFSLCSCHHIIMKFSGVIDKNDVHARSEVKGQGHRGQNTICPFPDCNSSLNLDMAMKLSTKLEVAWKRCPIVFQGHPSNFTWDKKSMILTQIGCFWPVTPVWIYQLLRNDAQSFK